MVIIPRALPSTAVLSSPADTATGETEWTINGRCTGKTDLPLTRNGEKQVRSTGAALVGPHKLLAPSKLAHVFVSPRQRAQKTFELLLGESGKDELVNSDKVTITELIAEWDYGDYEGVHPNDIRSRRVKHGLDKERPWNIWIDGCEGGEWVLPREPLTKRA